MSQIAPFRIGSGARAALRSTAVLGALVLSIAIPRHLLGQTTSAPASDRHWRFSIAGGGSYALSDVEIVPGVDQNGGWAYDVALRAQRARFAIGAGYERHRFDVGPPGSGNVSSFFVEPRYEVTARRALTPYAFAHVGRVVDYETSFCCSVYPASKDATGWIVGGGFGFMTAPVGRVRFDLSTSISRLSGNSEQGDYDSWKGAGPMLGIRLGAIIPVGAIP